MLIAIIDTYFLFLFLAEFIMSTIAIVMLAIDAIHVHPNKDIINANLLSVDTLLLLVLSFIDCVLLVCIMSGSSSSVSGDNSA